MSDDVVWKLVVDDEGSIKKMEEVGKAGKKTDKELDKTKKTSDGLKGSLKNLGGAFGGLKSMIGMASGALGLFGAGYGIENIISTTKQLAEETEKFHSVTGMSANSSLDYVAALKARGIGTEAVVRGYKALGTAVRTAERGEYTFAVAQGKAHAQGKLYTGLLGTQSEAFQHLGISLTALKAMSPEKQFQTVTEKLEGMKAGLQKTQLASTIFGKGATALLPVLEKGPLSLNHYRAEAEKFFPTLKGGTNIINEMNAASAESKMAWEGMEFTLGTAVMPQLVKVERGFAGVISEIEKGKGPWKGLESDMKGIATAGKDVVGWLDKMGKAFDIPVGAGGLAAALMAFGGIKTLKHPIKTIKASKTVGKDLWKAGKFIGEHPETVTAAIPMVGYAGLVELVKHTESALGSLKVVAASGGGAPTHYGSRQLGELARAKTASEHENEALARQSAQQLRELTAIRSGIEQLHNHGQSGQQIIGEMHMDSTKVGEVIALNPKAMRFLAEAVERASLARNARR